MSPPTGDAPADDIPAGARRERRTVLPPLPLVGGSPTGAAPAPAAPPAAGPSPVVEVAPDRAAAGVEDAGEPAAPPAAGADAGPPAPAAPARPRAARADGTVPRITRGRRRRGEPAPGERPDRRLPVYFWFHNVRFLRELRLDMEAAGARPGDLNDSLLVRAVVTALERTGMERVLRACRNEDQMVRAVVARLQGADEATVLGRIAEWIAAERAEAGTG